MGTDKKNDLDDALETFWNRMGYLIAIFFLLAAAILIWMV